MTYLSLTPAQRMNRAKKHYIGALHHKAFRMGRSTVIDSHYGHDTDGISTTEAQILVANKMALLNLRDDGTIYLSETLHGAKHHGKHSELRCDDGEVYSSYTRSRGVPVDMDEVFTACSKFAYRFFIGKMY